MRKKSPSKSKMKLKKVKFTKKIKKSCNKSEPFNKLFKCQRDNLYSLLKEFKFPTTERNNVLRSGQTKYEGFVLGIVNTRGLVGIGKMMSVKTQNPRYRELYLETKKLMDLYKKEKDPKFKYTSIQYNKSHRAAYHVDAKNVGESYIIGLGNYTGGEVIVYDVNGKNPVKHDIKHKFLKFNGSIYPHETAPFKGDRYTMVFYKV